MEQRLDDEIHQKEVKEKIDYLDTSTTMIPLNKQDNQRNRHPVKRTRWDDPLDKLMRNQDQDNDTNGEENKFRGGIPIHIPEGMTNSQLRAFQITLRMQEIAYLITKSNNLKDEGIKELIPPESRRSPSPEPIYGSDGKRINTREYRYKTKLLDERNYLIEEAILKIPNYQPPPDYIVKPTKIMDKVYLPANDYPEINFIGQLLGPRGSTLKRMELSSGARISIRGKGSVKEGKSKSLSDGTLTQNEEEDLHCIVTADSEEKLKLARKEIEKVIETAVSVPEKNNELKRMQLRYLAELNGTLREETEIICNNCGNVGHKKYECPERVNYTMNITCKICGNIGHMAKDCKDRNNNYYNNNNNHNNKNNNNDNEYNDLMAAITGEETINNNNNINTTTNNIDNQSDSNHNTQQEQQSNKLPWEM